MELSFFSISVPPRIQGNEENDYPVQDGMPLDMECRVTDAFPPPTIEWYKGLQRLTGNELGVELSQDKMTLRMDSVAPQDAGEYICIVFNSAGNTTKKWNLDVHSKNCGFIVIIYSRMLCKILHGLRGNSANYFYRATVL